MIGQKKKSVEINYWRIDVPEHTIKTSRHKVQMLTYWVSYALM